MKFFTADSPVSVLRALRSVVSVRPGAPRRTGPSRRGPDANAATGFYVGEDIIVTARHTAMQSTGAQIHDVTQDRVSDFSVSVKRLRSDRFKDVSVPAHGTDVSYDVGFYGLNDQPRESLLPLSIGEPAECGERLAVVGVTHNAEDGYIAKFSIGKLSEIRQFAGQPALLLFEAATQLGVSGGPVVRMRTGEVVGVLSGALEFDGKKYAMAWSLREKDVPWTIRMARSGKP